MRKILLVLGILIVVSITVVVVFKPERQRIEQESKLESRDLTVELRANGTVAPKNRIALAAAGRVEKVCVKEGETVKKGHIVAYMGSDERTAVMDAAENVQELKKFENFYKPTPLRTPIAGTVIKNDMKEGQTASKESIIIADDLIVYANIDETDIKHIAPNLNLKMHLDAYPDEKFEGTIGHIAYEAHTAECGVTTYGIEINPKEKPKIFKSGMSVVITITIESKRDAMSIPNIFIKEDGQKKTVTIKTGTVKKPIFETREVTTGITDGKFTEIVSGLNTSETIVTLSQKAKRSKATRAG